MDLAGADAFHFDQVDTDAEDHGSWERWVSGSRASTCLVGVGCGRACQPGYPLMAVSMSRTACARPVKTARLMML